MRTPLKISLTLALAAIVGLGATIAGAGEIPAHPDDLKYGDLKFDLPDADALRFELDNGTPVYLKSDHLLPLVNMTVSFRGGRYLTPEGKEGLTAIADEVWRTGGAGDRSPQQLDEDLDYLAAIVSTSIGDVSGSVSLNVLSKDLDEALAIFMSILTEPAFDAERFAKAQDDMIQAMKRRNDDIGSIASREWDRLMYGEDYWMNRLATQASVDGLTPEDATDFVNRLVRSGTLVVAISGDITEERAKELLNPTIGRIPALRMALPPVPQPDHKPRPGVYVVNKTDVNQGQIRFGQPGFKLGDPDEFALRVGNDILGGGGFTARMMKKIRSDEGLTYGAYSSLAMPITMPGTFSGSLQTKSSTVAYATELIKELMQGMQTGLVTDEEINTTKASFVETFPRRFESAAQTAGTFASDELLGRPEGYWSSYRDKVSAVTPEEIKRAFAERIDPDTMVLLVVGNLEEIMKGHPDHESALGDFGEITELPLRDPMTLEPIVE
jgi:zinc protease